MTPAGFEPAVTGSERIQTPALDRAATEAAASSIIDAVCNTEQLQRLQTTDVKHNNRTLSRGCQPVSPWFGVCGFRKQNWL
jgi:hypothetical protein